MADRGYHGGKIPHRDRDRGEEDGHDKCSCTKSSGEYIPYSHNYNGCMVYVSMLQYAPKIQEHTLHHSNSYIIGDECRSQSLRATACGGDSMCQ